MNTLAHTDRYERASKAIDRIADGFKELYALYLESGDRANADELGTGPGTMTPIATPATITEITRPEKTELTVKELAARWGVSTRSIYQWTYTHGLPVKRMGRLKRFDLAKAEAWADGHRESLNKHRLRIVK